MFMMVRQLGIYGFRGSDIEEWEWGESIRDPTWEQIERAIRKLDAGEYAGVVLHLNYRADREPATESFSIMGGPAGYHMNYHIDGKASLDWTRPEASVSGPDVGVVLCHQGFWFPESEVCQELNTVIAAAHYFFETGEPHPEMRWEGFNLGE
jgi:hypothetical protein